MKLYVVGLGPGEQSQMTVKALEAIKKSQIEFYIELTKELYVSNKLDCSRSSDKCRRKRVSYMANKLRQ